MTVPPPPGPGFIPSNTTPATSAPIWYQKDVPIVFANPDVQGRSHESQQRFAALAKLRGVEGQEDANGGVFISYRRTDEPSFAGRLYDKLAGKFGDAQIFMDVDSIGLGYDFVQVLADTLAACSAMIVIIGPNWLNSTDEHGQRRLDDPEDFVRLEIETALTRNIRVIPVLVSNARIPRRADLPAPIASLSRRNGLQMSHARFGSDCVELIRVLEAVIPSPENRGDREAGGRDEAEAIMPEERSNVSPAEST